MNGSHGSLGRVLREREAQKRVSSVMRSFANEQEDSEKNQWMVNWERSIDKNGCYICCDRLSQRSLAEKL